MSDTRLHLIRSRLVRARRRVYELLGNPRYSQPALNNLDQKLAKYLDFNNGSFIEIGANDGYSQSNTYYLEKLKNWRGVLVEPIPALFGQAVLQRTRSRVFNCACVPFDYVGSNIEMTYSNLMSLVKGALKDPKLEADHIRAGNQIQQIEAYQIVVPVRTLTSILDECGVTRIDFFSLDVEGFELDVLKGLDFERYRPRFILIEARFKADIDAFLKDHYTVVEQMSELDYLYCSRA